MSKAINVRKQRTPHIHMADLLYDSTFKIKVSRSSLLVFIIFNFRIHVIQNLIAYENSRTTGTSFAGGCRNFSHVLGSQLLVLNSGQLVPGNSNLEPGPSTLRQ